MSVFSRFASRFLAAAAGGVCLFAAGAASGVEVRIATMNVCNLGSEQAKASLAGILQRVQPDVLALQECSSSHEEILTTMCAGLPKPLANRAFMQNPGTGRTTASGDKVAIFSRWPIASADIVKENYHDPDAVEFMRWPIHAKISVPGALNPLHVITLHSAATTVSTPRRIWRGLEAARVREYVEEQILGADANDVEYVVLGDFNDSAPGRWDEPSSAAAFQPESFTYAQFRKAETNTSSTSSGFGKEGDFRLGRDHPWYVTNAARESWTMPYRTYPTARFGEVQAVPAFQTGSSSNWVTEWKHGVYRLDYILFSREIMESAYGAPAGEVYHSLFDGDGVGLDKPGPLPDAGASTNASDHLLVFSDFHLIDEIGGLTPVAILSEIAADGEDAGANFVEICNTGTGRLDLDGYSLELYAKGDATASATLPLGGISLGAGKVWWAAASAESASDAWGTAPDGEWGALEALSGGETIVLRNAAGNVHDIYGAIGQNGLGKAWAYADSSAARAAGVTEPTAAWRAEEWDIRPLGDGAATPGRHTAVAEAQVALTDVALHAAERESEAPKASEAFCFTVRATPNAAASNLAAEVRFRVDGGAWIAGAMADGGDGTWRSPDFDVARYPGSVMEYAVSVSFDGPGDWSPAASEVFRYTFPGNSSAEGGIHDVLFSEIRSSGKADEFIELAGGVGTEIGGWSVTLYDGAAQELWTAVLPADAAIPAGTAADVWTNPVGFYVLAGSNAVAEADAVFDDIDTGATMGWIADVAPRILVLRDAQGAVKDAVALATTNEFVGMAMPAGLSTGVARGTPNFLHCLGRADTGSTSSLQAPDNLLTGCTEPSVYALPAWNRADATPGAINDGQTNGQLVLTRVDSDGDGLLDDEDNCPAEANTAQSDIDADGIGDACDPDMDGDGIPNGIDNCPAEYNPMQEDYDADGIGNACDPDYDEDEWANRVETVWVTFEGLTKAQYAASDYGEGGRTWHLTETRGGGDALDKKIGERAMRTRTNNGVVLQLNGVLTNGLDGLSFFHGRYKTDTKTPDIVAKYLPPGADEDGWVECWRVPTTGGTGGPTPAVTNNLGVPAGSGFGLWMEGGNKGTYVNIDNILLVSVRRVEAECELDAELTVEWNGAVHTNDFTVSPGSAAWSVLYERVADGLSTDAPVEIGDYTATVTVEGVGGGEATTFVFPGSLHITEPRQEPEVEAGDAVVGTVSAMLSADVRPNGAEGLAVVFEYGTSLAFGNKALAEETAGGTETVPVYRFIEGLQPETLYYWRALAGNQSSEVRNFTTAAPETPVPELYGADSGAALLQWKPVEGAVRYEVDGYTLAAASGAEKISENFQSWSTYNYNPYVTATVRTQTTAHGEWRYYRATVSSAGSASGIGSKGYVILGYSDAWLETPPLDGVDSLSFVANTRNRTTPAKVQMSTDGGNHFEDVATFTLSRTASSHTCSWPGGQAAGTVFRIVPGLSQTIQVYDVAITSAGTSRHTLAGMPASCTETLFMAGGLETGNTYFFTVQAEGNGWKSEVSEVLEVTLGETSGTRPAFGETTGQTAFSVGEEGSFAVRATGDPRPELALAAPAASGAVAWTTGTEDGAATGTLAYVPSAADIGTQTFVFTASNWLGAVTQEVEVAVSAVAPALGEAQAVTPSGFAFGWNPVAAAEGYEVQLSENGDFTGAAEERETLEATFEDGVLPEGWEIGNTNKNGSLPAFATNEMYAAKGTSVSLRFNATLPGRYVRTPLVEAPETLSYWYYVTSDKEWTLVAQVSPDGESWTDVDTNRTEAAVKPAAERLVDLSGWSNVYIRLIDQRASNTTAARYVDEITVTQRPSGGEVATATVTEPYFAAEGLEPGTTYYVRAKTLYGGDVKSGWSETASATTRTEEPATGAVEVALEPEGIGGTWFLDGDEGHTGGETVEGVDPGQHEVTFGAVEGYFTPESVQVLVVAGETNRISGVYQPMPTTGAVEVALEPEGIGGTWSLAGESHEGSGLAEGLLPGEYEVTFGAVEGYVTPVSVEVIVVAGETNRVLGVYEPEAVPTETSETPVPVPFSWLAAHYGEKTPAEYETIAAENGANGLAVWVSYALGLDPTDEESRLAVAISPESDATRLVLVRGDGGTPPEGVEVRYVVLGVTNLANLSGGTEAWQELESGVVPLDDPDFGLRFFGVRADIGEGEEGNEGD